MPSEIAPRAETAAQIVKFGRFAIWTTFALVILLLLVDFAGEATHGNMFPRFLSEKVLMTFVIGIAAEAAATIAAVTVLLWKGAN